MTVRVIQYVNPVLGQSEAASGPEMNTVDLTEFNRNSFLYFTKMYFPALFGSSYVYYDHWVVELMNPMARPGEGALNVLRLLPTAED